jgi:hypothetical protein
LGDELTPRPDAGPHGRPRDPRADVIGGLWWMQLVTTEREREGAEQAKTDPRRPTEPDPEQD